MKMMVMTMKFACSFIYDEVLFEQSLHSCSTNNSKITTRKDVTADTWNSKE